MITMCILTCRTERVKNTTGNMSPLLEHMAFLEDEVSNHTVKGDREKKNVSNFQTSNLKFFAGFSNTMATLLRKKLSRTRQVLKGHGRHTRKRLNRVDYQP